MRKLIVGILLCAGCGCDRHVVDEGNTLASLDQNAVVAVVNGDAIRASEICNRLKMEVVARVLCSKSAHPLANDPYYTDFPAQRVGALWGEIINATLVDQEARRTQVTLSAFEFASATNDFLKAWHSYGLSQTNGIAELSRLCGVDETFLTGWIATDARREKFYNEAEPRCTNITSVTLAEYKAKLQDYNRRMTATNAVIARRITAIRDRILISGESFEQAAEKESEVSSHEGTEWGKWCYEDFDSEGMKKVRDWAFSAKAGDIGGPFELEDGVSIVKLLSREDGPHKASMASDKIAAVRLARLTLKSYQVFKMPTDEAFREQLKRQFRFQINKSTLERKQLEMRIDYPCGTNLFDRLPDSVYVTPAVFDRL